MAKAIIIYESVFGNTRQVAEAIAAGMKEGGMEVTLHEVKAVDTGTLKDYDAVLVGSPNHVGGATIAMRRFIGKLGKLKLDGKWVTAFDTYGGSAHAQALKQMTDSLAKSAPGMKLVIPGLSAKVTGMKGPLADRELPRSQEFGKSLADKIKG
jgi:flavorubredoxin